jgi:hypothetical protein
MGPSVGSSQLNALSITSRPSIKKTSMLQEWILFRTLVLAVFVLHISAHTQRAPIGVLTDIVDVSGRRIASASVEMSSVDSTATRRSSTFGIISSTFVNRQVAQSVTKVMF